MTNLQCSDMNFMLPNKQINDASSPNVTPTDGNGEKKKKPKKKRRSRRHLVVYFLVRGSAFLVFVIDFFLFLLLEC